MADHHVRRSIGEHILRCFVLIVALFIMSLGIALSATMLTRLAQFYQANLVGHVNQFNPLFQSRFRELTEAATVKGMDGLSAQKAALGILYRIVERESGILAYTYIFWVLGISFLVIIPFLWFLKKPRYAP